MYVWIFVESLTMCVSVESVFLCITPSHLNPESNSI